MCSIENNYGAHTVQYDGDYEGNMNERRTEVVIIVRQQR